MAGAGPQRDWRKEAAAIAGADPRDKRVNLFVVGIIAAALIGTIVGLFIWLYPNEPPIRFVSIPFERYSESYWPPVPYARADAARLRSHFLESQNEREVVAGLQESTNLKNKLLSLRDYSGGPLVIHITGLAVADSDGLYLLTNLAKYDNKEHWLKVDELFDAFCACKQDHKLLILDLAHPVADPARGVLADVASTKLHELLSGRTKAPDFSGRVLVSTGPGEESLVLDELQGTAFAWFLDRGMSGAADGFSGGSKDGWIRTDELIPYVIDRVARWSVPARGRKQTVTAYGNTDFRLCFVKGDLPPLRKPVPPPPEPKDKEKDKPSPPPKDAEYTVDVVKDPDWLAAGWAERDRWIGDGVIEKAPLLLQNYEKELLQAEQELRAGIDDAIVYGVWKKKLGEFVQVWAKYDAVRAPAPPTTAHIPQNDGFVTAVRGFFNGRNEAAKFAVPEGVKQPTNPNEVAAVVWQELQRFETYRDKDFLVLVGGAAPGLPECLEAALLVRLGELFRQVEIKARNRDAIKLYDNVRAAVLAEQAMLECLAACGPAADVFPRFRKSLEDILVRRAEAEKILWSLGTGQPTVAERTGLAGQYSAIRSDTNALAKRIRDAGAAVRTLAEARALLPGYAAWLNRLDANRSGPLVNGPWNDAVNGAVSLSKQLADENIVGDLDGSRALVESGLAKLRAEWDRQVAGLPDGIVAPALLASPRFAVVPPSIPDPANKGTLPAARSARTEWLKYWHDWCAKRCPPGLADELKIEKDATDAAPPATGDDARTAFFRAQIGLGLARLAGKDVDSLIDETKGMTEAPPTSWNQFGPKLAKVVISGGDGNSLLADPFAGKYAAARQEFWSWLAKRYEADAQFRGQSALPLYESSISNLRAAVKKAGDAQ